MWYCTGIHSCVTDTPCRSTKIERRVSQPTGITPQYHFKEQNAPTHVVSIINEAMAVY